MKQDVAQDLEAALLERAHRLAEEHLAHARDIGRHIREEADERLRRRDAGAQRGAAEQAERGYRRCVEAEEIRLREALERRRWDLIQEAMAGLQRRLIALTEADDEYLAVLRRWLSEAAAAIPRGDLRVQLNARDRARLAPDWQRFTAAALPGRVVALDVQTHGDAGGLHLRDADDRTWVDDSFTGRLERLTEELHQVIAARLFPAAAAEAPHAQ